MSIITGWRRDLLIAMAIVSWTTLLSTLTPPLWPRLFGTTPHGVQSWLPHWKRTAWTKSMFRNNKAGQSSFPLTKNNHCQTTYSHWKLFGALRALLEHVRQSRLSWRWNRFAIVSMMIHFVHLKAEFVVLHVFLSLKTKMGISCMNKPSGCFHCWFLWRSGSNCHIHKMIKLKLQGLWFPFEEKMMQPIPIFSFAAPSAFLLIFSFVPPFVLWSSRWWPTNCFCSVKICFKLWMLTWTCKQNKKGFAFPI